MKISRRQIFLIAGLVVFLGLLIMINFYFKDLVSFWKEKTSLSFKPPLQKETLKNSSIRYRPDLKDTDKSILIAVPAGEKVYAMFSGTVTSISKTPETVTVFVKSEDEKITAAYSFWGEVLVEEGGTIKKGQPLAVLEKEYAGLLGAKDANLGIWFFGDQDIISREVEKLRAEF